METNLHSLQTYLYKYLLPVSFIPWDGFRSVKAAIATTDQNAQVMLWLFFGSWSVITPLVFWYGFNIKRVLIEDKFLRFKSYLKEIEIPLDGVESVREYGWPMRHVTLRLKTPSEFGDKVWFMPKRKIEIAGGRKTPLAELLERVHQANERAP